MAQIRMDMDEGWMWYPVTEFETGEVLEAHLKELEGNPDLAEFIKRKNTPALEISDALMTAYREASAKYFRIMDIFEGLYRQQEGLATHPGHESIPDARIKKD
jgi:hypothetical protein